jgi:aspartyl-tRNA(Asn)/glutamyl-tRNA(Gln) amidotransferase subunit C
MALSPAEIDRLAQLARLKPSPTEMAKLSTQLEGVLLLVEQLRSVNTTGVAPMTHPRDMALRLRPDEVSQTNQREALQANAPAVERGLFLVPKVIE